MTSLKGFVRGIPQGLPQSYFLGNICMIPISGIFSKVFKGLSYYYVDDSIIFTNYVEEEAFEQQLKRINKEIENLEKNLLADWPDIRPEGAVSLKKEGYYGIKVHESIKSSFTRMDSIDSSEVYLKCVSREASQIGNEIFRMFSDEEDVILEKRMKVLSAEVQKKIDELDQKIDEWNQKIDDQEKQINLLDESELVYSKRKLQDLKKFRDRWIRYYKFFEYRSIKMGLRSQQNKDTLKDIIFVDQNGKPDIIKFMEHYRENIWDAAIAIYSNSLNEHKGKKELGEYINEINTACFGYENQTSSYLYKVYDELISQEVSAKMSKEMLRRMEYGDPYRSLKKYAVWKLKDYANKHYKVAETVTEKLAELSESEMLGQILSEKMVEIMQVVCANTEQVLRMVSNTVYSYLFNVEIEDSFVVTKSSRKPLSCGEMRILLFLRNRMFSEKEFKERKILLSDSGNKSVIDYSIMEVVDIFRSFVGDPVRIDKLILTHQYTCEIWKNGSKHLYFYTLHNQEHAIVLIRNIVKLVHAIGFLQVSSLDFYILFLACYLHDISMVKIPSLDSFLTDTEEADRLALEFILEMFPDDIAHVKRRMVEVYQKVDGFFEKKIRSNHAADSAYEIREQNDFEYLEDTLREFVAEVSEAHNSDVGEIYYTKSTARSKKISMKFDKMLLRLADVLDMSNYRISRPILHHNLDQMSNESAFHWISHLLTQGYEIETEYQSIFDEKEANQDKDVRHDCSMIQRLAPKSITEKVVLTIYVDMSQMSQLDIQEKCSFAKINREDIGDEGFELTCGTPCGAEGEEGKRCNFLCRWFTVKNKYLLEELAALQEYLNRTPDNYFLSVISVRIKVAKKTSLDARQFEVLKEYLQDK